MASCKPPSSEAKPLTSGLLFVVEGYGQNEESQNPSDATPTTSGDDVKQECSPAAITTVTVDPPPPSGIASSSNDQAETAEVASTINRSGLSLPMDSSVSYHSLLLDAAAPSSLASSINDLSFEAEQLDRAIRLNDTAFVRRMLELHHSRFSVYLHGSLLDKSSDGSQSHCVSQDVEILLRKSQTFIDRFDRNESLSSEHDISPIFANALHIAVEHNSLDVARLLLKYGVDPNECGTPTTSVEIWRRHSCCAASEGNVTPYDKSRRFSHLLTPDMARFLISSFSANQNDSNGGSSPSSSGRALVVSRPTLDVQIRTVYCSEGKNIIYDDEYTRETLYTLEPLYLAVASSNASMVHLLLKYGAFPNAQDRHGVTPLHIASCQEKASIPCVRLLLERGAKTHLTTNLGVTPGQLLEQDLRIMQLGLIDTAFCCLLQKPTANGVPLGEVSFMNCGKPFKKKFLLKKFHDSKCESKQSSKNKECFVTDDVTKESPEIRSFGSHAESHYSESLRSQNSLHGEDEKSTDLSDKGISGDDPSGGESSSYRKNSNRPMKDDRSKSRNQALAAAEASELRVLRAEFSLNVLTKMSSNLECLIPILSSLEQQLLAVIELTNLQLGHRLHRPLSALMNQLLQTTIEEFNQSTQEDHSTALNILACRLCQLLNVAIGCLRGGQSLQYSALLLINKAIDTCIVHPVLHHPVVSKNPPTTSSPKPHSKKADKDQVPFVQSVSHITCLPWKIRKTELSGETSSGSKWWSYVSRRNSRKLKDQDNEKCDKTEKLSQEDFEKPLAEQVATPETFMNLLSDTGIDLILTVLNNAITLHKRVVGTRHHCSPSHRWRHCSYHCLQILSARVVLFSCQNEVAQKKLMEEPHLKILRSALDSTLDPQLLCLILQVIATLSLSSENHEALIEADIPDCLTQLVLPSDEWYYTNHSTKYARYVKHHASRVLVYLGQEVRLRSKNSIFDLLEDPSVSVPLPTSSQEDAYIITTSLPPSSVIDISNCLRGATLETIVLAILRDVEQRLRRGESDTSDYVEQKTINKRHSIVLGNLGDDPLSFSFVLMSLTMVTDPIIVLRLLQHRLLSDIVQKPWQNTNSRCSVGSWENRSRASSGGNEDSLRARRKVNLTINCSSPTLTLFPIHRNERRNSIQGGTDSRALISQLLSMAVSSNRTKESQVPAALITPTSKNGSPSSSPSARQKRSFRFSSLRKKRQKLQNEISFSSTQSEERNTSEADIAAFQKELQNLPNFDLQPSCLANVLDSREPTYCRPRSCSVPRVLFDGVSSLQLPAEHGLLIRSATTEGTSYIYPAVPLNQNPSSLSPGNVFHVGDSPTPVSSDLVIIQKTVLKLLLEWAQLYKSDLTCNALIYRELKELLLKASCLSEQYQHWVEELKIAFDIQETEDVNSIEKEEALVNSEYEKLQRLVVSGDLPCSKEEAAILAGIQLRIEETWPTVSKRNASPTDDNRLKLRPISEDTKEILTPESATEKPPSMAGSSSEESTEHTDSPLRSLNSAVMKVSKSTAILRNWMSSNGSKDSPPPTSNLCLEDCVPPIYRHAKNMARTIKEQKRKLFHSPVYDDEHNLKKFYVHTCKRLPAFGCRVFQVKESVRGKTKKKANRLLGIGVEKVVLLDSKTLLLMKSQLTCDLQQWRIGGGRSRDQLILEFRATKWSFIAASQGCLHSINNELWEVMQDLDARFLDEHVIATRKEMDNEIRKNVLLNRGFEKTTSTYKAELERLQAHLHFPENVAFLLTEVEYELFYKVTPIQYVRQMTLDISRQNNHSEDDSTTVQALVKRFQEVSSWVTHIIISQPTHEDRKAVLSCILRVAMTCWNLGNFNTATEILAGLKSEKLKPFWLSLSDKDHVVALEMLSKALFSSEISAEYRAAVDNALGTPYTKVLPFFGNFLRDLRAVLKGVPSLVVLSTTGTSKLEFISDFHGEDHFFSRIGVGGIINMEKLRLTHQIIEDIQAFHLHAQRRAASPVKPDPEEHLCRIDNIGEDESLYEFEIYPYPANYLGYKDTCISFFPLNSKSESYQLLQTLHHGITVIHWDEDGSRSSLVYLRLERSNGVLTWCKPLWSGLRGGSAQDYCLSADIEDAVSPGMLLKYEGSDVAHINLDEGYIDLTSVKEIVVGNGSVDLNAVTKKFGLEDQHQEKCVLRLLYGTNLSDNRTLEFVAPSSIVNLWHRGITHAIEAIRKQKQLSDRRIYWLKERYLQLYYEELACCGPTPAEAIKLFGGRKWTLGSLGGSCSSMDTSGSGFKRVSSFGVGTGKLRKKKSSSSLSAIRDCSPKSQVSAASDTFSDMAFRRQSPSIKVTRSSFKSCSPLYSASAVEGGEECLSPGTPNGISFNATGSNFSVNSIAGIGSPNILNVGLSLGYRQRCRQFNHENSENSSPMVGGPAITHSSQMDFLQFAELFRSFLVRSRKDLRSLFEQITITMKSVADLHHVDTSKLVLPPPSSLGNSSKVLGLLSRNTPFDYVDSNHRKKICDAIAAASIVSNCAGVDTSKTLYLRLGEFQHFLNVHQGERKTDQEVALLIQRHEPDAVMRNKLCLSFEGFARYLLDKDNYVFVNETRQITPEDMDQPLSHYFIASSHNTYLTGHQLKGESSVELYSQVLLTGCRCVELDCWDGDEGTPVIYHGHTLTTKIPFKSVVDAINKSAFVTSPYPVILSIENHCSLSQQAKMAQIFMSVFGDRLVTRFLFESDFYDDPQLPSPNQLKYRVLIKNKKMRCTVTPAPVLKSKGRFTSGRTNSIISTTSTGSFNDEDDDDYEDDEDDDDILEENFHQVTVPDPDDLHSFETVSKSASLTVRTESISSQDGSCKDKGATAVTVHGNVNKLQSIHSDVIAEILSADEDKNRKSSSQIAPELSDLVVYCQAIKFRGFVPSTSPTNSVKIKKMSSKKNMLSSTTTASTPNTPPLCSDFKSEAAFGKRGSSLPSCYQVSSINESTAKKLCKRHPLSLISHCETQIMRTYPAGMRIDSSNFNPVIFWSFGIQMVALNYQTEDAALHVNNAMFEQNGRCGYVLKPRVMWDKTHMMYGRFNPWEKAFDGLYALSINISVISGQYVCPSTHTGSPQVEIEILGIPVDCCRQKTKLVQRNSLNPIWNDTFHFRVTFGDLAFIRFCVMDMGTNHVTAQRVIPLLSLKQGYRHVRLCTAQNQALPLSTLFISSSWEEEGVEILPANAQTSDNAGGRRYKGEVRDSSAPEVVKGDSKEIASSSVPMKRRMFFLMVHGVVPDEPSTILKITQESTTRDVIIQALSKTNNTDSENEYVLIEEVQRGWEKKITEKTTTQRFLDPDERPLEAQALWQGEGKFILKKLADDPSTRAWMTTIQSSANKEKQKRQNGIELTADELRDWTDGDDVFLVCVYNVSPDQPYAILKASISSSAQDILAQALVKARRMEDPSKFILIEEVEYPPSTECTPSGAIRKRGIHRERRVLDDYENVFLSQQRWKAKGWFELRDREPIFSGKRNLFGSRNLGLGKLSRLRPAPRSSKNKAPLTPDRRVKSLNEGSKNHGSTSWRQVHSEGEFISDEEVKTTTVMKYTRMSLRKLKVWR